MAIKPVLTLAVRFTRRRPLFCLNVVLLLCLGIGLSMGTFGLVYYMLTESLPYRDSEKLVLVHDVYTRHGDDLLGVSEPEILDYRNLARSFTGLAAILETKPTLTLPEPRRVNGVLVTTGLFDVLGVKPRLGRGFVRSDGAPDSPPVAIVSSELYQSSLSCPGLSQCRITVQEKPYTVIGVLPPSFRLPNDLRSAEQTDLFLPVEPDPADLGPRDNPRFTLVGRLKDSVELAAAQAEMNHIAEALRARHPDDYIPGLGYGIQLREVREAVLGDTSAALKVTILSVAFLFLVALTNAGNFLMVASEQRTSSFLTSLALGAPLGILRAQLLVEACLLAVLALVPGVALGWFLFTFVTKLSAGRLLPLLGEAQLSPATALFALLLVVLASAILFLIPQGSLTRSQHLVPTVHREVRTATPSRSSVRNQSLFLVLQMAFSTALLALFLIVGLSQRRLHDVDLGFKPEGVHAAEVMLPSSRYPESGQILGFFDSLLTRARSERGLERSCLSTFPPLVQRNETWPFEVSGRALEESEAPPAAAVEIASGGCLGVLGISLREGADLPLQKLAGQAPAALVSESLARRLWPSGSAIGQRIRPRLIPDAPWITVVGVVNDIRHEGPTAGLLESVYLHYKDVPALTGFSVRLMRLITTSSQPAELVRQGVRRSVSEIDAALPVEDLGTLGELNARLTAPWRFTGQLLGLASILGPLIAVSGLYSLLSTLIVLRRKELGIRIALGATKRNLLSLLSRQTLWRLLGGGMAGIWLVLALFPRLQAFLPQTTFPEAVAASIVGLLALLAAGVLASASLVPSLIARTASAYRE